MKSRASTRTAQATRKGGLALKPGESPPQDAPFSERPLRVLALPLALATAAAVHAPALRTFFAQDDVTFLARARGIEPTPWSLARPLSEGWMWRMLHAAFGLHPLPYHLFNFALHLANTALVYVIGTRLLRSRGAGFSAALLFGASSIAFTPLHWASCLVELLVTTFTLAAFAMFLATRERRGLTPGWAGVLLILAALLSKESAILFPVVLLVVHFRLGDPAPPRSLAPQSVAVLAYAAGFLATLPLVHYAGSETYSMSRSPWFIGMNLATYLRWIVALYDPVRDAIAAMNPAAWRVGLPVALLAAALLWLQRRERRHPEEVGAAWFLAMLAPVVALRFHTYLYYLYLPWPGACWMLAGAGQRLARRRAAAWAMAILLAGFVVVEYGNVRTREHASLGTLPLDKTVREAMMLENAVTGLGAAGVAPGDRIAFVNSAPRRHFAVAQTAGLDTSAVRSYLPLEGALRQGEAIRVFFPGARYLGFAASIPREWEDARTFLYQDEGTLRDLGRGSRALAELGYFTLQLEQWKDAEAMFLRSQALGDTLPDAVFGMIVTSYFLGREDESRRHAEEFLRRWPSDPRAPGVAAGLRGEPPPARPAPRP